MRAVKTQPCKQVKIITKLTKVSLHNSASQVAQWQRIHLPMQEMGIQSLGQEKSPEKEMATHSSTVNRKISWTEESGGLQSNVAKSQTRLSMQAHFLHNY